MPDAVVLQAALIGTHAAWCRPPHIFLSLGAAAAAASLIWVAWPSGTLLDRLPFDCRKSEWDAALLDANLCSWAAQCTADKHQGCREIQEQPLDSTTDSAVVWKVLSPFQQSRKRIA